MRTMGCETAGLLVSAYVDGELVGEDRDTFEAHVRGCARCRARVDAEQALMSTLRAAAPVHRAPAALRESTAHLLSAPRPLPSRRWLPALAAALLLATGAAVFHLGSLPLPIAEGHASSALASLAVDTHLRHARGQLPLEVRSERPPEVTAWFAGRVPFQLALPDYPVGAGERKPYTLVGGRLISFHGDYAAYVAYQMEERPISLVVTSSTAVRPDGGEKVTSGSLTFHIESVDGLKVITWTDRGLTYALVSDFREDGAQSCLVCHGTDQERRKLEGLRRHP